MSNTQETIDFIVQVGPPRGGQLVTTINYDPTKETLTYIFQPYNGGYAPQTFKLYDIWIPPSYMKILKFISIHFPLNNDDQHPMGGVKLLKYINDEIKTDVLSVRMQYNNMKKETELKNKEKEFEEKDKLLKNKERYLEEKDNLLKNKEKDFKEKDNLLKNKERDLEEKDNLLKILKEEFEEKLEYKEIELTIIKEEFEEKEIGLKIFEQELEEKETELKTKDKILKSKEKELRKKDDILETLKEELEEKNEKIVKLKKIIRELESDNEILEIKNGKFKQKLAELEN